MKYVSTEQMEAVRLAYPRDIASPAFVVYARPKIKGSSAVYYGFFGPDEGCFPPSLGWRRLLVGGIIFKIVGDTIIPPDGISVPDSVEEYCQLMQAGA